MLLAGLEILPQGRIRFLWDGHDTGVYFASSRWIVDGGTLYTDVPSEYPLLANLIFAVIRVVAWMAGFDQQGFALIWVAVGGAVYGLMVARIAGRASPLILAAWLAPAPIYFAALRYDVYPAAATLLAMLALRRDDWLRGAFWLGIAIALKGYALVVLPAVCVFALRRAGFATAVRLAAVALIPIVASFAVSATFAGWRGAFSPVLFHARRGFNGETTYDALNYVLGTELTAADIRFAIPLLQIGVALAAAATSPRTFEQLAAAMTLALVGFIAFSAFQSPQFVLWILPVASFVASKAVVLPMLALAWLTYLYFPIAYDIAWHAGDWRVYRSPVVLLTLVRIWLLAASGLATARASPKVGQT